jgi:hypothetical protein
MRIKPKNWASFQHYKDRSPPWIKLHKVLLDDYAFNSLPDASRALAPCLWLVASEHSDGEIDATPKVLAFRLRRDAAWIEEALNPLMENGFFLPVEQAESILLASRKHVAMPEERRGEVEKKHLRVVTDTGAFGRFWETWPSSERKVARKKCAELWKRKQLDAHAVQIIAHVEAMKVTDQWQRGYEPSPLTYLNQSRWEDSASPPANRFAGVT